MASVVIVAGIDPGKGGALAVLDTAGDGLVRRVPLVKLPKPTPAYSEWQSSWSAALAWVDLIVLEQVGARPTQGTVSMFNFGRVLGFAHCVAVASGARIEWVTPATWKGKLGLLKADKNASREKARQLYPKLAGEFARVKDDGAAEAALLAFYGHRYLLGSQ